MNEEISMDKNDVPEEGISVVICCYNSAAFLPDTLRYLGSQKVRHRINWEIVLVNNNSTDNTVEIAKRLALQYNLLQRLKIVNELKSGLANARKKGAIEAKYDYLIFCDDDNWLYEDYIERVFDVFNSDSKIGAIGGTGIPKFENDKSPKWFEAYKASYACGKQGEKSGYVTLTRNYLYGAGLSLRKELLMQLYNERVFLLSDRKGTSIESGGDGEITMGICLMGYELYFDSELLFFHFIPERRLTFDYLKKLHYSFGKAHYHVYPLQLTISGNKIEKYPRNIFWDRIQFNFRNIAVYLLTNKETSSVVNGAWAWGLFIEAFKDKILRGVR